jgi:hypothetical protein
MTKNQVEMISPVYTSIMVGPLPKSTWAASPGFEVQDGGDLGVIGLQLGKKPTDTGVAAAGNRICAQGRSGWWCPEHRLSIQPVTSSAIGLHQ